MATSAGGRASSYGPCASPRLGREAATAPLFDRPKIGEEARSVNHRGEVIQQRRNPFLHAAGCPPFSPPLVEGEDAQSRSGRSATFGRPSPLADRSDSGTSSRGQEQSRSPRARIGSRAAGKGHGTATAESPARRAREAEERARVAEENLLRERASLEHWKKDFIEMGRLEIEKARQQQDLAERAAKQAQDNAAQQDSDNLRDGLADVMDETSLREELTPTKRDLCLAQQALTWEQARVQSLANTYKAYVDSHPDDRAEAEAALEERIRARYQAEYNDNIREAQAEVDSIMHQMQAEAAAAKADVDNAQAAMPDDRAEQYWREVAAVENRAREEAEDRARAALGRAAEAEARADRFQETFYSQGTEIEQAQEETARLRSLLDTANVLAQNLRGEVVSLQAQLYGQRLSVSCSGAPAPCGRAATTAPAAPRTSATPGGADQSHGLDRLKVIHPLFRRGDDHGPVAGIAPANQRQPVGNMPMPAPTLRPFACGNGGGVAPQESRAGPQAGVPPAHCWQVGGGGSGQAARPGSTLKQDEGGHLGCPHCAAPPMHLAGAPPQAYPGGDVQYLGNWGSGGTGPPPFQAYIGDPAQGVAAAQVL